MGTINETLSISDGFSASFNTFNQLGQQSINITLKLDQGISELFNRNSDVTVNSINNLGQGIERTNLLISQASDSAAQLSGNMKKALGHSTGAIIGNMRQLGEQLSKQNQQLIEAINNQKKWKDETENTNNSSKRLLSTIKSAAAALGAVKLAKSFLEYADTQTQIIARLNLMNDGLQSTEDLNEMIYQSAQRSRASYASTADAIAKMGLNAGNAFSSNQELIAFMEAVNKQFAIGGGSAAAMEGAMVQLTQAMSSGALRGEELSSILDAAPGIARNIEQYMGWASGSIKQYAEDGMVSAEVVKNAMLSSAESIDEQFNSMPMTLSQAMTQVKNEVQHTLQSAASEWNDFINSADGQRVLRRMITLFSTLAEIGVTTLQGIGSASLWAVDNLDFIIPVLAAIAAGFAVVKAQAIFAGAASVASALKSAAAWAVANWPIVLLVAVLAGALIALNQFGIGAGEVGAFVGGVFGYIYAIGYNVFAALWNVIASFAEFFANVWNDPLGAVARLFFDLFDSILGIVETVAGAIDALLGTNMSGAVSGFRGKMSEWVTDTFGESAVEIKRMANLDIGQTSDDWAIAGGNIGAKLDNMDFSLDSLAGSFSGFDASAIPTGDSLDVGKVGSVGSVKNVEGDVNLSDEDLKLYRDLAERKYMANVELQTVAPQINVSIPESAAKNLTAQDIADMLKTILIQQSASHTAVSHG